MNCGLCDKTDGMCYTSQPPQVKCTVTGEFHFFSDKCNVIELFQKLKAERDAAVRDLERLMKDPHYSVACGMCVFQPIHGIRLKDEKCPDVLYGECRPKWRGPQQEET